MADFIWLQIISIRIILVATLSSLNVMSFFSWQKTRINVIKSYPP